MTLVMKVILERRPHRSCRRCGRRATRPRGLCWTCYYTPGVKEAFAPLSSDGQRGRGGNNSRGCLPDETTDAIPGSEEKIQVLTERASRGESLFHPFDSRQDRDAELPIDLLERMRQSSARPLHGRTNNLRLPRVHRCHAES